MDATRIIDLISGKNVFGYYKLYSRTQWFDEQEMETFQLKKFKSLINHCYVYVPFYTRFMKDNNIKPEDINSLKDLELFPIITKEIIKENYNEFIPTNLSSIKGVKTSQTGGTTGNILFTRNDANTRSSVWATFKRFEDWMGIRPYDKKLELMGGHVLVNSMPDKIKKTVFGLLTNTIEYSIYKTTNKNLEKIISALITKKVISLRSYCQYLFHIAKELEKRNIEINIKAINTTAEPLLKEQRDLFTSVFNAEVYDQYGCGEIGGIAYECQAHNGLHISEERVIVEQSNNDLLVTDLDNYSLPFIRYWNADQAIISNEKCSCGRKSRIIKQVMGRTCDYIIGVNNEFLHWAYFWHLLFDSKIADKRNLRKFQIIQEDLNSITIKLVSEKLTTKEEDILIENIKSRLGDLKIIFNYEKDIENTKTGKYRPVINKVLIK